MKWKIYIGLVLSISIVMGIGLLRNCQLSSSYDKDIANLSQIIELVPQIRKRAQKKQKPKPIANVQQFFKRAMGNFPMPNQVKQNAVQGQEQFTVHFIEEKLSRVQIVHYVVTLQKRVPHLKLKKIQIEKDPSDPKYQDQWKTRMLFAYSKK